LKQPEQLTFEEFAARYHETQEGDAATLRETLLNQQASYQPDGWLIAQCQMLDSSYCGQRVILPYGPNNTLKEPPTHPFSPRGLASDQSTVEAIMLAESLSCPTTSE